MFSHVVLVLFSEEARREVVRFFQRQDAEETNCGATDSRGWLLLKALLLLTADNSVSESCKLKLREVWFPYFQSINVVESFSHLIGVTWGKSFISITLNVIGQHSSKISIKHTFTKL